MIKALIKAGNKFLTEKNDVLAENCFIEALKLIAFDDYTTQFICFKNLGDIYFNKTIKQQNNLDNYIKAAALFQYALKLSIYDLDKQKSINGILANIKKNLHEALGIKKNILLSSIIFNSAYKNYLFKLRNETRVSLTQLSTLNNFTLESKVAQQRARQIQEIYLNIEIAIKKFITLLFDESIHLLGPPPCQYTVITLASCARQECTPYSDIEFAILIEKEDDNVKKYFREAVYLMYLEVINLGETLVSSVGLSHLDWFYDSLTPRGFAFDGVFNKACKTPLGRNFGDIHFELIHTPVEMANFQKLDKNKGKYWFEFDIFLASILTNVSYVTGSQLLFTEYQALVHKALTSSYDCKHTVSNVMARRLLNNDLNTFGFSIENLIDEENFFSIKQNFYRLVALLIEDLCILNNITVQSTWNRIEALFQNKIFNEKSKNIIQWALSEIMYLRVKNYLNYDKQYEYINLDLKQTNVNGVKSYKNNIVQVKNIYKVLFSLQIGVIQHIKNGGSIAISLDKNLTLESSVAMRVKDYSEVIHNYKLMLSNDQDNVNLLNSLGYTYAKMGNYEQALYYYFKALRAAKNDYFEPNEEMANRLSHIALLLQQTKRFNDSIYYAQKSFVISKKLHEHGSYKLVPTLCNLSSVLRNSGARDQALLCLNLAESINIRVTNNSNNNCEKIIEELALIYRESGDLIKSINYHNKLLILRKAKYGNTHPKTAQAFYGLGVSYYIQENTQKSLTYLQQSLHIYQILYNNNLYCDIQLLLQLSLVYRRLGCQNKSLFYMHQAYDISRINYTSVFFILDNIYRLNILVENLPNKTSNTSFEIKAKDKELPNLMIENDQAVCFQQEPISECLLPVADNTSGITNGVAKMGMFNVHNKYNAYAEAKHHMSTNDFTVALIIAEQSAPKKYTF